MKTVRTAALAAVLAVGLSTGAQAQSTDMVVATVNGTAITLGHMLVLYERLPDQYRQLPPEALYDGILDQLIQQTAIGATVDNLSERAQLTMDNEKRALKASEVIEGAVDAAMTDDALQAVYDRLYGEVDPEIEYNANHILVETEEEAARLKTEIDGGADFEEMAKQHSTGPSGPNGGALGWFSEGMMVPAFEEAVIGMEPGAVTGPVQTQFGWHLIKLNETRQKAAPDLDSVREELEAAVREDTIDTLVEGALASVVVERSDEEIDPAVLGNETLLAE